MDDPRYRKLMDYALRALSRRAHTRHEMRLKLKKYPLFTESEQSKNPGADDPRTNLIGAVILRLEELGLLDDAAFIQRSVEEASRVRLQGRMKVISRLYKKGIPSSKTEAIWRTMNISEKDLAKEALKRAAKRFGKLPKNKLYRRRAQFLTSRGFSPDTIYALLGDIL